MTVQTANSTFEELAAMLLQHPDIDAGTGFGNNSGLRSNRKIFAILIDEQLVVKLPAERCTELVADEVAVPFNVGRRRMREWICITNINKPVWTRLAYEARAYASASGAKQHERA